MLKSILKEYLQVFSSQCEYSQHDFFRWRFWSSSISKDMTRSWQDQHKNIFLQIELCFRLLEIYNWAVVQFSIATSFISNSRALALMASWVLYAQHNIFRWGFFANVRLWSACAQLSIF